MKTEVSDRYRFIGVCAAMLSFVAVGCQSKDRVAHENYVQIRQDVSSKSDVKGLLGEPDQQLGDMWLYNRPDRHLTVMIDFDRNGTVERAQWIDGQQELWQELSNKPE